MGKIINRNGKVLKQDENYSYGTVIDFLAENDISYIEWNRLSDLVKTMAGDACTSFNTIGELIQEIPEIVSCREECSFLCIFSGNGEVKWFILGYDYEGDTELSNKILRYCFPDYEVLED